MAKKLSDKSNYVSKRSIKSITVKRGNKTTEIDSKNLFDGAYVKKGVKFEDGGGLGLNQKMTASEFKEFIETAEAGDTFQLFSPRHKDEQPYDCVVTRVRHKPEYKLISVTHKKFIGGAGVYNYKTDESAEENYAREFKGGHRDFPLRLRRRKKGMSKYAKGGSTYRNGGDVNNPSKKEMLDYLNMYFDYYDELRTIAIEEDNILTRKMLNSLDDEELEMAYDDAKYEIKADTYAKGGSMKVGDKKVYNKLVGRKGNEYYFLDYVFKHENDFMGAVGTVVTPVHSNYFEYATSRDGLAERYLDAMSESEWCNTLGLDEDDCTEEEIIDGIENLYRVGELQPFEECSSKEESQMREIAEFSDSNKYPLFEVIGGGRSFDKNQKFDEVYDKSLLALIIKAESNKLANGGMMAKGGKIDIGDFLILPKDMSITINGLKDKIDSNKKVLTTKWKVDKLYKDSFGKERIVISNTKESRNTYLEKVNSFQEYLNKNSKMADGGMMAKGGGVGSKKDKAMKKLEKHIEYEFVNTDMGSGWAFSLDGFDLEMRYLDVFDGSDLGIEEDWDDLSKEDKKYYYEDWKETLFESSYESFKDLAFKKYGYYYMENGGNMNDDKSYICTYEIGGL